MHQEHDTFFDVCKAFDATIVRCNPGQIKADGGAKRDKGRGCRSLRRGLAVGRSSLLRL